MPRVTIADLGGSINQGRAPSEIGENEYTRLRSWYQFGAKLRRRGGTRKLNPTLHLGGAITGILTYRPENTFLPDFDVALGHQTGFAKLNGDVITDLPPQTAFVIEDNVKPWSMFQFKNIWYGLRQGAGLIRSDGTYFGPAGISAPSAAATLADGGAGAITAGDYKGVYTFYNSATGVESDPSPVTNTLTLGASRKINWSGIGVSTNVQVNARRLYRSLANQSGEYFLVAEIPNNVDTTYVGDNVVVADLGETVSFDNGTPPANLLLGDVWRERLFCTDGKDLFHSADGLVECFDPDAFIPVFEDDGHPIRAIHAHGDRLIVGKTNKIHYLVGSDPDSFQLLTLSDRHGCLAHHTMQSAEGHLFWLGLDNVYRSDGGPPVGIAGVKLRDFLADINARNMNGLTLVIEDSVATVFPALGWYVLSIPIFGVLVYNYNTDVWMQLGIIDSHLEDRDMSFVAFGDFYDENNEQHIYASGIYGDVYEVHDTTYNFDDDVNQNGNPIECEAVGRAFQSEAGTKHIVTGVGVLTEQADEDITLAIETEGVTIKERTVSLNYETRWKPYLLSTRHQAKSHSQLRVTYSGETPVDLEGLYIDIQPLGRPSMQPK